MNIETPFVKELINQVADRLHGAYFSEEYDGMFDSISDARDRRRGKNPMNADYIQRMDQKRIELGVRKLNASGKAVDGKSRTLAHQWAYDLITADHEKLQDKLSHTLFLEDPAGTMCKENECEDEYDVIAASILENKDNSECFEQCLKRSLEHSFGADIFVDPRIHDESLSIGERKRIGNINLVKELSERLIASVASIYIERFKEETKRSEESEIKEILTQIQRLQSSKPTSNMGAWGASATLKQLNTDLDCHHYLGLRPLRTYSPPPRNK